MVNVLQIAALFFFAVAAYEFAGPLKAGVLPETLPAYILLFFTFILLGVAELLRRVPPDKKER